MTHHLRGVSIGIDFDMRVDVDFWSQRNIQVNVFLEYTVEYSDGSWGSCAERR